MMPIPIESQASVPPSAYHSAQARLDPALHIDALTMVTTLHLLTLCRLAARLAHRRYPPPYLLVQEELHSLTAKSLCCSLRCGGFLIKICATGCALALACGLPLRKDGCPRIPCPSPQCKGGKRAGAALPEALFILTVLTAICSLFLASRFFRFAQRAPKDRLPSPLQEGTVLDIPVVSVLRTKRIGWLHLFVPGIVLLVVAAAMAAQWIH